MKSFSKIAWPNNESEARRFLLEFFLVSLEPHKAVLFDQNAMNDPFVICQRFLNDEIGVDAYESSTEVWWDFLTETGGLRAPRNREHAIARIALCMLSLNCGEPLEDQLSFFLESLFALDRVIYQEVDKAVNGWFDFSG
jgi:hypothetical protein